MIFNFDTNFVDQCLKSQHYSTLANYLNSAFKLHRDENGAPIQYECSIPALCAIHNILQYLQSIDNTECVGDLYKAVFRSLRNYVINSEVQQYITNNSSFLNDVATLVDLENQIILDVIPLILQFLSNLIISNSTASLKIYILFQHQLFYLLKKRINVYEAPALLYNISLHQDLSLTFDMYSCIIELFESNVDVEFLYFLCEKFINYEDFWKQFKCFPSSSRLAILDLIRQQQVESNDPRLSEAAVETLTNQFINSGNIIFQTVATVDGNLEPYEVSQLLKIISSLCGNEKYLKSFQENKDLLINSGILLINIHRLGKESENYFSSVQHLSEIRDPLKHSEHPAFGFKADLIRIIGNLCWKNKIMQDLAREAELIPVILDCCNIDARNPLIMQWVILAVRNICEKNLENQEIIAGLCQRGTVSSSVLEEMGLTLQNDKSTLKIIPLDDVKHKMQK